MSPPLNPPESQVPEEVATPTELRDKSQPRKHGMKIKTLTDKAKTSRKAVLAPENPSLLSEGSSVTGNGRGCHRGPSPAREKREKEKEEERKDTKTHPNSEAKRFQSSRHGSEVRSFPAGEETIPAALPRHPQPALVPSGENEPAVCISPPGPAGQEHQGTRSDRRERPSEDHEKREMKAKNSTNESSSMPPLSCLVQKRISLTNQTMNHSAEIL